MKKGEGIMERERRLVEKKWGAAGLLREREGKRDPFFTTPYVSVGAEIPWGYHFLMSSTLNTSLRLYMYQVALVPLFHHPTENSKVTHTSQTTIIVFLYRVSLNIQAQL